MFYDTLELRWFGRGPIPAATQAWFDALPGLPEAEDERVDCYLGTETADGLGVKLRDGALEIKQRLSRSGTTIVAAHCAGRPEGWRKWRFLLARQSERAATEGGWLSVPKRRQLRRYRLVDGDPLPADGDAEADAVCRLELSRIELDGEEWWTLGLESPAGAQGLMLGVAHGLLNRDGAPVLPAQACRSYPAWLARRQP